MSTVKTNMRSFVKQLIGEAQEAMLFESDIPYELTVRRILRGVAFEDAIKTWLVDETALRGQQVSEGTIKCRKCGSRRILSHSLQTRSADEGETFFHFCTECSARWRV